MSSSFRIDTNPDLVNAVTILGIPITSAAPANGDTLTYDSATNTYMNRGLMTTAANNTIPGNIEFTGITKIGTNGSNISRLEFGSIATPNLLLGQNLSNQTIAFGPFPTVPLIIATVQSGTATDRGIPVVVSSKTVSSAVITLLNVAGNPATVGPLTIQWIAID